MSQIVIKYQRLYPFILNLNSFNFVVSAFVMSLKPWKLYKIKQHSYAETNKLARTVVKTPQSRPGGRGVATDGRLCLFWRAGCYCSKNLHI